MDKNRIILNFRLTITLMSVVFITSCNNEYKRELEEENAGLHHKIATLEQNVKSLSDENEKLIYTIEEMRADMREIQRYAREASINASQAAFWSNTGDSFFFESELRNMSSNFNNIAAIASKN